MDREHGLAILAGEGWLAGTSEEFRALFLPMARWRSFAAGTLVTMGGEEADDIIGLASGSVAFTSALGLPEAPAMHVARAVFWLGYGPILLGGGRVMSAEARTEVWVASFPKARVLTLLDGSTRWWRYFTRLAGEYGHNCATIASDLLIPQSERRCAAVLLRFGGCRGSEATPMIVPVTQGELAAAANLSRNSAGAILRGWAARGLIETGYGGITIADPAGLRAVFESPA
jgi:CRP/FNR family transcriptional regulator, cyclic AMP receptor protein